MDDHLEYGLWDDYGVIQRGENIDFKDEGGDTWLNIQNELLQTPLHVHLKNLRIRSYVVESLLEKGADPNLLDVDGNTPLHYLMGHPIVENTVSESLTRTFLKYNAKVDVQNKNGNTPLHLAVYFGNVGCITPLFHTEASTLIKNNENLTAMGLAYMDRNIQPEVFIVMAKFSIILNNCGKPVNRQILDEIHSNEILRIFNEQCKEEISVLSNTKVGDTNVTLNVILKSSTKALAKYLKNDEILEWLQNFDLRQYNIFGNRLHQHFKKGLALKEAEDSLYIFFRKLFPNLPELCVYAIMSYIKKEDLKQFEI